MVFNKQSHKTVHKIKMDNEESHFNVSLTVRDKVTRLSINHSFCDTR